MHEHHQRRPAQSLLGAATAAALACALLAPAASSAKLSRPYPANAYTIVVNGSANFKRDIAYRQNDSRVVARDTNSMSGSYQFLQSYRNIFVPRQRSGYETTALPASEANMMGSAHSSGDWSESDYGRPPESRSYACTADVGLTPGFEASTSYHARKKAYRLFFSPADSFTTAGPSKSCTGQGDESINFSLFGKALVSAKDEGSPNFTFDSIDLTQRDLAKEKITKHISDVTNVTEESQPNLGTTSSNCIATERKGSGEGTLTCGWHQEWKATVTLYLECRATRGSTVRFQTGFTNSAGEPVAAPVGKCKKR